MSVRQRHPLVVSRAGSAVAVRPRGAPDGTVELAARLPAERGRLAVVTAVTDAEALADALVPLLPAGPCVVRLVLAHAAAGADPLARRLADLIGSPVAAADGPLLALPEGSLFVLGPAGMGRWWRFTPGGPVVAEGQRFPAPAWERLLPDVLDQPDDALTLLPVPAGLWLCHADDGLPRADDLGYAVPPDPDLPMLLVGRPGGAPVPAAALRDCLAALPEEALDRLIVVEHGGQPATPVAHGQQVADGLDRPVRLRVGTPIRDGRGRPATIRADPAGDPAWRPLVTQVTYRPGRRPLVEDWSGATLGLPSAGHGVVRLGPHWVAEAVPAGLWLRPPGAVPIAGCHQLAPDPDGPVLVCGAGEALPATFWPALELLAGRLSADQRARLLLVLPPAADDRTAARAARIAGAPGPAETARPAQEWWRAEWSEDESTPLWTEPLPAGFTAA